MEDKEKYLLKVTFDTVDGPEEYELDLNTISLDRLEKMLTVHPELVGFYYERLLKEQSVDD